MTPRDRRLASDLVGMREASESGVFTFDSEGDLPEEYHIQLNMAGLQLDGNQIVMRNHHVFRAYLHRDYPRRPPVLKWETPVFHPNILDPSRTGGVCIGGWSASESLADLVLRVCDLVSYESFSTEDALDTDAAAWVTENNIEPGCDLKQVVGGCCPSEWVAPTVVPR